MVLWKWEACRLTFTFAGNTKLNELPYNLCSSFVFVFFFCSVGRSIIPLLPGGCRRRLVLRCMEKMLLQRNRYKIILIFNRCWKIWAWRQCFFCMQAVWSCANWKWPIYLVLRVKTANNTVVMRAIQVISLASFPFVWLHFFFFRHCWELFTK